MPGLLPNSPMNSLGGGGELDRVSAHRPAPLRYANSGIYTIQLLPRNKRRWCIPYDTLYDK